MWIWGWPFQDGASAVVHFTCWCNLNYWWWVIIYSFVLFLLLRITVFYDICNEPQQNLLRRLLPRKTGLIPAPPPPPVMLFIIDISKAMLLLWFILIVNVRPLVRFSVCLSLFWIVLWPSVGKGLSPWHFTCAVYILLPS